MTRDGKLEAIWSKEAHDGPMRAQDQAALDAGGMQGDANHTGRRPITLIEREVFARISSELGQHVDPIARRANLMVSGVSLAETVGQTLRVGSTRIRVRGETRPCALMDEAYRGLRDALSSDWGGGVYGDVVEGGTIQVGDPVGWSNEETDMTAESTALTSPLDPIRWDGDAVRLIDQRLLPRKLEYLRLRSVESVAVAIETLAVRGAPAIGIAAGYGVVLATTLAREAGTPVSDAAREAITRLRATRPTAVNLFYALDRMEKVVDSSPVDSLHELLLAEANAILDEDLETGSRIAEAGLSLFPNRMPVRILTHCNAGGLATGGWGTALAPIYAAARKGMDVEVLADETRPLLQGRRLTAWEMSRAGIPVNVLVDGAAASVLRGGNVDLVIVGADRVVANGDTANKIGTFAVALAARDAGVPFYVAAPASTFDLAIESGDEIPVEERTPGEVLGEDPAEGIGALNPAFDVTPARLITGWITDRGVLQPPFTAEALGR